MGALLDDAGALAIIFTHDDQRAADDAGRRQIGQRIRRHVGADDGFPSDRATHRIIDRGCQKGGRSCFVGTRLEMHAQVCEYVLGLQQHIEQVADRRALVAADVADARLQQRLGDGQNALAAKLGARAKLQIADFLSERDFHGPMLPNLRSKKTAFARQ